MTTSSESVTGTTGARARVHTVNGNALWTYSADTMLAYLMMKSVSPMDLAEASLTRIAEVNPVVNAVVESYGDEALRTANKIRRSRRRGRRLNGIPVTIKDNIEQQGHVMSEGVRALRDNVCKIDAPLVSKLKDNGAIIVGRTNCPPHCWQLFSSNELYGTTTNPRNPQMTPGGSSGGAAVSVATGMVPIAQGNDIAGSIRYPAYANGIVGLRPTNGSIPGSDTSPMDKSFTFQLFASQGVLARTVSDAFLGYEAMRGYSPADPASHDCDTAYVNKPHMVVGIYLGTDIVDPQEGPQRAVIHAARALDAQGWGIEFISTDVFRRLLELEELLVFGEFFHSSPDAIAEGGEILRRGLKGPKVVLEDLHGSGYELTLDDYIAGLSRRGSVVRDLRRLMDRYPVILTPASAEPPFLQDEDQTASMQRAREMTYATWPMQTVPVAGLPAIVLPTDVIVENIPLGVQLITRVHDERTLHTVARDLERYFDLDSSPVDPPTSHGRSSASSGAGYNAETWPSRPSRP